MPALWLSWLKNLHTAMKYNATFYMC